MAGDTKTKMKWKIWNEKEWLVRFSFLYSHAAICVWRHTDLYKWSSAEKYQQFSWLNFFNQVEGFCEWHLLEIQLCAMRDKRLGNLVSFETDFFSLVIGCHCKAIEPDLSCYLRTAKGEEEDSYEGY